MLPPTADARERRLRVWNGMGREVPVRVWPRSGSDARRALYRARLGIRAVAIVYRIASSGVHDGMTCTSVYVGNTTSRTLPLATDCE